MAQSSFMVTEAMEAMEVWPVAMEDDKVAISKHYIETKVDI